MNNQLMEYKGFSGTVETSLEDEVLHGSIQFINDKVTYEAETVPELKVEFEAAVDDYLETCQKLNRQPNKPFSGTFQVRVNPEMHRQLATLGLKKNKSLNQLANMALGRLLNSYDPADETLKAIRSLFPTQSSTRSISIDWSPSNLSSVYVHPMPRQTSEHIAKGTSFLISSSDDTATSQTKISSYTMNTGKERRH
jgi:predicted HicB family RNase H-like nuclease